MLPCFGFFQSWLDFFFFEAVVNEIVFLISFFMFVIAVQEGYSFLYVNLVSCHFARCVYQLQEFPGGVLGDFMYGIILPANRDFFFLLLYSYLSLFYLVTITQTSSILLSVETGQSLVLDLGGNALSSSAECVWL